MILRGSNVVSFVIDSEIVAINPTNGNLKTFQDLSNRARKDVRLENVKISVCVFAFDLMFLNGVVSSLMQLVLRVVAYLPMIRV